MLSKLDFEDIRCFRDEECRPKLRTLLKHSYPIHLFLLLTLPKFLRSLGFARLLIPFARRYLYKKSNDVNSIKDFQLKILKPFVQGMLKRSCSTCTQSGLEQLDDKGVYLFISNHRDIVIDPALLNYWMVELDRTTMRIAVGDNLMVKDYADILIRLTKGVKVQRSFSSRREAVLWHKRFSTYVRHSIFEENHSLWIAQSNGRNKDGNDKSSPGLIKMLSLANRENPKGDFASYMQQLNIVPVAISYEYDPDDVLKAQQLCDQERLENYSKKDGEDDQSIAQGFIGWKGRSHVSFGSPLRGRYETPTEVAQALDEVILKSYVLYPSNYFAFEYLYGYCPAGDYAFPAKAFYPEEHYDEKMRLHKEWMAIDSIYRPYVLNAYANPLLNRLQCLAEN